MRPSLVSICLDFPQLPEREVWLLVRRDISKTPRVRAVIDYLIKAFEADRRLLAGYR